MVHQTTPAPIVSTNRVRIDRIVELTMPMFGIDEFFANVDPDVHDLAALSEDQFEESTRRIILSSSSYLVRVPGLTVLVDAGIGNDRPRRRPMFDHMTTDWWSQLTVLVDPEDVDVVVPTHLHVDHVGWLTRWDGGAWVPSFPRARYLFNRVELESLSGESLARSIERNGDYVADSITPVIESGLAQKIDLPLQLSPDVRLESAPGDTAGHLIVRVSDGDDPVALITGDAVHHVLQVADPKLSSRFAALPEDAIDTRVRLFTESADIGVPLLAGHIASHPVLRAVRAGDGFRILGDEDSPAA